MKLPHQAPIRFAHTIVDCQDNKACVQCTFPSIPSLAMLFEAAAQSSIAFQQDSEQIGYIVSVKDLILLQTIKQKELLVKLTQTTQMSHINEFQFIIEDIHSLQYAKGVLTLMMDNKIKV